MRQTTGKKDLLALWAGRLGLTRLLSILPKRDILLGVNYHRIGYADCTPYDPGVFSTTPEGFDDQIGYLRRLVRMVTLEEAVAVAHGKLKLHGPAAFITFDDGYRDNYQYAFPILQSHSVQGVFFLATSFVGATKPPWWDQIAFLVKNCRQPRLQLSYPRPLEFSVDQEALPTSIREVLRVYKEPGVESERFIRSLEEACGTARPGQDAERCFLDWTEAAEMSRDGMAIGSHTHSHEILSKLTPDGQAEEVLRSRRILEERLTTTVDTLAYPVGQRGSFSDETTGILRAAGYRAAFSFYGGFNRPGSIDPYNILRVGADGQSRTRFEWQSSVAYATGRYWL